MTFEGLIFVHKFFKNKFEKFQKVEEKIKDDDHTITLLILLGESIY
jgi:hypothetical protein